MNLAEMSSNGQTFIWYLKNVNFINASNGVQISAHYEHALIKDL